MSVGDDPVQGIESALPHRGDGQLILIVEDDEPSEPIAPTRSVSSATA